MEYRPSNSLVTPLLNDMYQLTMAYAYWKAGKHEDPSVFDLFYRKNPFGGEFCVFAGLDEVLRFVSYFRFEDSDIDYLKSIMPTCEPQFFGYLKELNCSNVRVYSMKQGSVVFPKEPLLRVEGPLGIVQLLETTLLNLINYPSLITTNAVRMRIAAGPNKNLLEFGLRRAQGPDGGLSGSKYSYLGGFTGTSHVLAGKLFGMAVRGTHAHSFVMSYTALSDLHINTIVAGPKDPDAGKQVNFLERVLVKQKLLGYTTTNEGELAAFIAYAQAFPAGFLALVDTYDILQSGIKNFLVVGAALWDMGYKPIGVRIDSGDLAHFSKEIRKVLRDFDSNFLSGDEIFRKCTIVASNDINEQVILELNRVGHEIDTYGIGTHLITCQAQPALGCVYKLVEIQNKPRIKLSQEIGKMVIPGRKVVYRIFGEDGKPLMDVMMLCSEPAPKKGERLLVRHPFEEHRRVYVTPSQVNTQLSLVFDGSLRAANANHTGVVEGMDVPLEEARAFSMREIGSFDPNIVKNVQASGYKLMVSQTLYEFIHKLWSDEAPIPDVK